MSKIETIKGNASRCKRAKLYTIDDIQGASNLKNITGIKGTLLIDNFPIPVYLNGTESIWFDEEKRELCFVNNVTMFNPNDNKEYLVDIVFTGNNSFYADFILSTVSESYIRVYFYDCDEYRKYFEIVVHEEE